MRDEREKKVGPHQVEPMDVVRMLEFRLIIWESPWRTEAKGSNRIGSISVCDRESMGRLPYLKQEMLVIWATEVRGS